MGLGLFGVPWKVVSLDPEVVILLEPAQPPVDGMTITPDPQTAVLSGASSPPSVQWLGPGVRVVKLDGILAASGILVDLRPQRDMIAALTALDPILGRAPRVSLTWGDDEISGFVTACPQKVVRYWATGEPQIVEFSVEVTEAPETSIEGVSISFGESLHLAFGQSEGFETLGRRYLGAALSGELIRRINPKIARDRETSGTRAKVFEKSHPAMRGEVRPVAPCFARPRDGSEPWAELINEIAATRSGRGLPLRLLPELEGVE